MNTKKLALLFLSLTLLFTSCSSDDDNTTPEPLGDYENGILISNQGNFTDGFGTVSYISNDFATTENNIFSNVNGRTLGAVAQSITFNGDLAYIIINASNQIEVVNRYTFQSVATIDTGLSNPRYMAISNGKGYVTNWGEGGIATDDYIAILDLTTNIVTTESIAVEEGPESILAIGNTIYVAHQGGFSQNNIVSVINTNTDAISTTITVGDVPNSMQLDANENLWVLCGGIPAWTGNETAGKLSKINTNDNTVTSIDFATSEHPNYLALENGVLYYYMSGGVYKMNSDASVLPSTAEITGLNFNGMTVKNSTLYGVDAGDFASNGIFYTYDLSSNTMSNSTTVGVTPGGVYFN